MLEFFKSVAFFLGHPVALLMHWQLALLLQRLGWPSVQKLINKETGSMVYKSLNSLASPVSQ